VSDVSFLPRCHFLSLAYAFYGTAWLDPVLWLEHQCIVSGRGSKMSWKERKAETAANRSFDICVTDVIVLEMH
jgi:hypothetical protein